MLKHNLVDTSNDTFNSNTRIGAIIAKMKAQATVVDVFVKRPNSPTR